MKSLVCRFLLLVAVVLGTNNAVVVDAQSCSDISKCDECLEAGCASSDRTCYDSCEDAEADHVRCYVWSEWSYLSSEELCELAMAEQLNQEEEVTVESVFEAPQDEEDDEEEEENNSVSTTDSPTDSPGIINNDNDEEENEDEDEEEDDEEDEDELEDTAGTVPPTPAPMIITNVANVNDTETEAVTLMEDEGEDKEEEEEEDEAPPEADNLNTNVAVFEDEEPTDTITSTNQTTGGDQGGDNGENPDDPTFEGWVVAEVNRDTTGASAAANTNSAMVAIGMSIIGLFSGLLGMSS